MLRVRKPVQIRRGRATVTSMETIFMLGVRPCRTTIFRLNAFSRRNNMSDTNFAPVAAPAPIPVGEILPWAIFGGLLMLIAIYFVGTEEGAMAMFNGMYVHE